MPAWHQAQPGENPMELISRYQSSRAGIIKIILAVVGLCLLCGIPVVFISKNAASKNAATPTALASITVPPTATSTATSTITASPSPTVTRPGPTSTPGPSATPLASQTPWIIITQLPGNVVEKHYVNTVIVPMPVLQTVIVTTTPESTPTPWLIFATVIVTVEVTPTETPTPSPTPTETPTEAVLVP